MANFNMSIVSGGSTPFYGDFDAKGYLNANPDVKKAILNENNLFGAQKYKAFGGGDFAKLGNGSDESYAPEYAAAINHYRQYGIKEGRKGGGQNYGGAYDPSVGSNIGVVTTGSGNSTTSNSLLNSTGGYLGTGVNFDDYVEKMKGLTDWKLGIDKRSMENAYGFRDKEANRDYGFQTGLAGQQIQGQKDIQGQQIEGTKNLETLRNEYMNKRQSEQLQNQRTMQEAGFGQQNKLLTDNAARAKSLYFGGN